MDPHRQGVGVTTPRCPADSRPSARANPTMETQLVIPRPQDPSTISELLEALHKAHFNPPP